MAVNIQKFLPSSKSSALAVKVSAIKSFKTSDENPLVKEILQIKTKIIKLQGEIDKNKKFKKKEQDDKRKKEEKEKRSKREQKLENKDGKGTELPNIISRLPGGSIVDSIKRFLGFTFLGWLVNKYNVLIPQLEKFMSFAKPVLEGIQFITTSLFSGIYSFVETGYKAYDSISAGIKKIGGEDAEKTFHEFSGHLNKLLNGALIAAMVVASTAPQKPKPNAPSGAGSRLKPGQGKRPKVTTSGGGASGKPNIRNPLKTGPKVTTSGGGASKPSIKPSFGRFPIIGPLITFGVRTLVYGERPEKAAAAAIGMGLGQAVGTFIGTLGAGALGLGTLGIGAIVAPLIIGAGSVIGGLIGEWIGASLYDFVAGLGKNNKVTGKARGGVVSKNTQIRRKKVKTQSIQRNKIQPQKTVPGKDIGGKQKIEKFYGEQRIDPKYPLTKGQEIVKSLEKTSKDVKKLPLDWLASIGGAYIDMTMGQKPDRKLAADVGKSFGMFVDTVVNNQISATTGQITKALVGMANGGSVPQDKIEDGQISKKVSKNIEQRLQDIFDKSYSIASKNLKDSYFKFEEGDEFKPGDGGPGGGRGAGGYAEGEKNFVPSKEIYDYLKSKGVSHVHAMGMLANIQAESSFNAGAIGDNGDSGGLFQHNAERFDGMVAFAGKDWAKKWKRQVDYALREGAGQQYVNKKFKNAQEASAWFTLNFERPANREVKARQRLDNLQNFGSDGSWKGGGAQPGSGIIKGGKITGGALITATGDPDAEQTGSDIAIGNYQVGAQIQNPFQSLKITNVGFEGSGSGNSGTGYGRYITAETVINGKRYEILLGHLDKALVKKGDILESGDIIGTQGISGHATGPHVSTHINALNGGDPSNVLKSVENVWVNGGIIKTDSMGTPTKPTQAPSTPKPPQRQGQQPPARQTLITRALVDKGTIPVIFKGQKFFFRVNPSGRVEAFKPKNFLGIQEPIDIGGNKNKGLRDAINVKVQTMYGKPKPPKPGPAAPGYGGNQKGGVIGPYSSINSLKEDTSLNQQMVVMYQRELVMIPS